MSVLNAKSSRSNRGYHSEQTGCTKRNNSPLVIFGIHNCTQEAQRQVSWMKLCPKSATMHLQSLIAISAGNSNLIERRNNSRLLLLPPMLGMATVQAPEVLKS